MTERQTFNFALIKLELFAECNYTCQNPECDNSIYRWGTPQLAHRIANTESNLKKYGKEVIHHKKNLAPVCCLKCNDAMNIGFDTGSADSLADEIRDILLTE